MGDWVIRLIDQTGYIGVFFLMLAETVFPPIPSEVIMPVAGMRAAQGPLNLWGVVASGTAGAMFGNFFWYLLARVIGMKRFRPFIERYGRWLTLDWPDIEKAERLFGRFGGLIVFFGRLLPTVRSIVSIPAGLLRMRLKSFLIWSTIGTAGWSAALAVAGYCSASSSRTSTRSSAPSPRDHHPDRPRLRLAPAHLAQAPPQRLRLTPADGRSVHVEQMRGIHRRVDLRRRQACMAEQLLQRSQVRAPPEQVRREAVAKRVRRGPLRQPEPRPRPPHHPPHQLAVQGPAPSAAKQRLIAVHG
jgi:membrane protein DedA with SNARE-associated domain